MVVAIARWLINPSEMVWLVHRRVQFLWIGSLSLWALAVRVVLRRGCCCLMLLGFCCGPARELDIVLSGLATPASASVFAPCGCKSLAQQLDQAEEPILLVLSQAVRRTLPLRSLLASLEMRDPRQCV